MNLGTAVKQEVAKQIAKKTENKLIMQNGFVNTPVGGNYTEYILPRIDTTSTYPLLPALNTGTELYERVGGVIEPKALKLRGTLFYDYTNTDASSRALDIRLMVLTNKSQRSMPDLVANAGNQYTSTLMWNGQAGDSTSYQGCQPYYNQLPINRKSWNVIEDRIIHLRKGLGVATAPLPPSTGEVFLSPQRSHTFEIVLTAKDLPASLKYDGGLGTLYPTNFAPVFYIGFVDVTGAMAVGDINSDKVVQFQYETSLIFEDS
jgi:hypothetical protein